MLIDLEAAVTACLTADPPLLARGRTRVMGDQAYEVDVQVAFKSGASYSLRSPRRSNTALDTTVISSLTALQPTRQPDPPFELNNPFGGQGIGLWWLPQWEVKVGLFRTGEPRANRFSLGVGWPLGDSPGFRNLPVLHVSDTGWHTPWGTIEEMISTDGGVMSHQSGRDASPTVLRFHPGECINAWIRTIATHLA